MLKVYFAQQFTLTFDPIGGQIDGSTDPVEVICRYYDEIVILDAPEREGCTFTYWKGSEYYPGDTYRVTGDHIFTAQWNEDAPEELTDDEPEDDEPKDVPTVIEPPKTGDGGAFRWILLTALSAAVMAGMVIRGRKSGAKE